MIISTDTRRTWKTGKKKTRKDTIVMCTIYTILKTFRLCDRRLRDADWLYQAYHVEKKTVAQIAKETHSSEDFVLHELTRNKLMGRDSFNGRYTGLFHMVTKKWIIRLLRPIIKKKIIKIIDAEYSHIESRNAKAIKSIIDRMISVDQDTESSSGTEIGLNRKDTYILAAKFCAVLFECDTYYSERIDWVIGEIIDRRHEFYFGEQKNPENWHPNRKPHIIGEYIAMRNADPDEECSFYSIKELPPTAITQTKK